MRGNFFNIKHIASKYTVITFFSIFLNLFSLAAKEVTIPMIKSPFPVKCITWNKDGKTFAYTEEANILVRNSEDLTLIQTITTSHGFIDFLEFTQSTTGNGLDQLASLTQNNILDIRILPDTEPINSIEGLSKVLPTAMAYSYNGNYIATATADGKVYLYMQNYLTGAVIERQINVTDSPAKFLSFSHDNKLLAIAAMDDTIYLVDVSSGQLSKSYPYKSSLNVPVRFTTDSKNLIFAKNTSTINMLDIRTNKARTFRSSRDIVSCDVTDDGKNLIILGDNNQIYFYDVKNGDMVHYIPSFNTNPITCYSFNNKSSKLAVGYSDGMLLILELDDVVLLPNQRPEVLKYKIPNASEGKKAEPTPLKVEKKKEEKKDTPKKENNRLVSDKITDLLKRPVPQYQTGHGLIFEAGISFPPDPYVISYHFPSGYENFNILQPFYFGGIFTPYIAVYSPESEYKYDSGVSNIVLANPYLIGVITYGNIGFLFYPFKNDIFVFAELDLGISLHGNWDGMIGSKYIGSKVFPCFYTAAKTGIGWRYYQFNFAANYDAILGYSIELTIARRFYLK